MLDIKWIRQQFAALEHCAYLNSAAASPACRYAVLGARRYYDEMAAYGDDAWDGWIETVEKTRQGLADFIGAPSTDDIAFLPNSSSAVNMFARLLPPGSQVVTTTDEFPTSTVPFLHRKFDVKFVDSDHGTYTPEMIAAAITDKTSAVIVSAVQYGTGFRFDFKGLGDLLRDRDVVYILNATQACGVVPIDVRDAHIDMLCGTGLKWMGTGYGSGFCYVRDEIIERTGPPDAGWQSVDDWSKMDNRYAVIRKGIRAIEVGCPSFAPIFAMGGALRLIKEVGTRNITSRVHELRNYLRNKIDRERWSVTDLEPAAGITLIQPKFNLDLEQAMITLTENRISLSQRCGGLRISTHYFNTAEDIDHALSVINRFG